MTQQTLWNTFLQTQPPVETQQPVDVMTQDCICYLPNHGLIKVCDAEAETFLQNQFCNDVRNIDATVSQLNGYCNPKGRLLAVFRLFKVDDCYYLNMPRERVAAIQQRLQMFVMMSRVSLTDVSDDVIQIGVSGPNAASFLNSVWGHCPTDVNEVVSQQVTGNINDGSITAMRVPGTPTRFLITGPSAAIQTLWSGLAASCTQVDKEVWSYLDIRSGIPQIVDATVEAYVPQMVNLQNIDGLSFKKGCYPGQEIVARMHYLGKQKRRMYLAKIDTDQTIQPGTDIYSADSESNDNNQSVGSIVSAAKNPSGGSEILAVLQIKHANSGNLHLDGLADISISLKDLPYTVEVEGDGKS